MVTMSTNNNYFWNFAEFVALSSSVAGAIKAVTTQQLIYAVAPLTAALLINVIHRSRLQRQIRQERSNIREIHQHVEALHQKVNILPDQATQTENFRHHLSGLEERILLLNEQFESRTETQDISEVTDQTMRLTAHLDKLVINQKQLKQQIQKYTKSFTSELKALTIRFDNIPRLSETEELEHISLILNQVSNIQQHIEDLDTSASNLHDSNRGIKQELQELTNKLQKTDIKVDANIQHQLENLQNGKNQFTKAFQQLEELQQLTHKYITAQDLEIKILEIQEQFLSQTDEFIETQVTKINQQIKEVQPAYKYHLVFDRENSHKNLLHILNNTKEHIILVCPWLCKYGITSEVLTRFKSILERQGIIDIGWGNLADMNLKNPTMINRQQLVSAVKDKQNDWKYNALRDLEELEHQYPNQFRLKLLGTHEKFWVCDGKIAMLGSHNFLVSAAYSQERELGIWTDDIHIIAGLIQRFNDAKNLEVQS
jgi:hypothetical protein